MTQLTHMAGDADFILAMHEELKGEISEVMTHELAALEAIADHQTNSMAILTWQEFAGEF